METTVFNPIQRHLLEMFSYDKSQEGLEELKEVLFQYYSKRMNTKLDELWDKGILDQKKLDEIAEMDVSEMEERKIGQIKEELKAATEAMLPSFIMAYESDERSGV